MFVFDTLWLCDVEWWSACDLCMHVCLLCAFIFLMIESNDECAEEGEVFEYQEEEDQGQATQGKPSTCCIPES
jgi:Ca2+/Na+ antiporter